MLRRPNQMEEIMRYRVMVEHVEDTAEGSVTWCEDVHVDAKSAKEALSAVVVDDRFDHVVGAAEEH